MTAGGAEAAFAFVARRTGRSAMPEADWIHHLSLGLGWMTPGQARGYVAAAEAAGLFRREDGAALALTFDAKGVVLPRDVRPDPDEVMPPRRTSEGGAPTAQADPFLLWVERTAVATGKPREAVLQDVARMQEAMGGLLHAEAAVLWLAGEAGLDVAEAVERAVESLKRR